MHFYIGKLCKLPFMKESPSAYAAKCTRRSPSASVSKRQPVYFHWFALDLFGVEVVSQHNEDIIEVNIDNENFKISAISMSDVRNTILSMIQSSSSSSFGYFRGDHCETEAALTAVVARSIDRFLFPNSTSGACFHQLPSRRVSNKPGSPECPDLFVLEVKDLLPSRPVMCSSMKKYLDSMQVANAETEAYSTTVLNGMYPEGYMPLLLGLSGAATRFQLSLHVPCLEHIHSLEIADAHVYEFENFKNLLIKLYSGVHYLLKKPIYAIEACQHIKCCDGVHTTLKQAECNVNVFHCTNKGVVWKYYDKNDEFINPHFDMMKNIPNYDKLDLMMENCEGSGRFFRIRMKFIEEDDECTLLTLTQAIYLIQILQFVHSNGVVHSDVRRSNMLIAKDGSTAFLIDFDLAGQENTCYPPVFNHHGIPERHRDAKTGLPRKKIHDRFSLKQVISSFLDQDQPQDVKDWIGKLSNEEYGLDVIIAQLKKYGLDVMLVQ